MVELYNGDCINEIQKLEENSVDMVLVDPPYGTTACKWDCPIPFDEMWEELLRVGKDNCVFAFTASQPFSSALVMSNVEIFRHEWIWIKNRGSNFANTVREPMKEHESVLIFSKGNWTYNKQMEERADSGKNRTNYNINFNDQNRETYRKFEGRRDQKLSGLRVPSSCQKFKTACGKEKVKHPTQKPVELMEYLIRTYTNENDVVLDFAMGSGTTGVACKRLDRNFIGIEINEEYFKMAEVRISEEKKLSNFF